jgi:hypothetical protein
MALTGIERIVRAVTDVLQDGMDAKLAALVLEYDDGIELPPPEDGDYYWYRPTLLPRYPAIIISAMPETASGKDLAGGYDFAFAFQVDIVVPAADPETAEILLWRYWRAVKELLSPNGIIDNATLTLQAVDWNQPVWTPEGFSGPVKEIPGLFTVSTDERA